MMKFFSALALILSLASAFQVAAPVRRMSMLAMSGEEQEQPTALEEKMKSWEATDEELKAASLGGVVPKKKGDADGFDIGLYIAFPFMVLGSLLFAVFPFIMDKIDVSSVGPPPMT